MPSVQDQINAEPVFDTIQMLPIEWIVGIFLVCMFLGFLWMVYFWLDIG